MNRDLYTIGELSRIKNISAKALRFYDKIGLLEPHYINPVNQYRYYHISQMLLIDIIKAARKLDISPNDLIPLFQRKDTQGVVALLEAHKEKTLEKIHKLQEVITGIDHIRNNLIHSAENLTGNQVVVKALPTRHVITLEYEEHEDPSAVIIDYSKLDELVDKLEGIATYESGVIYSIVDGSTLPSTLFTSIAAPIDHPNYLCIPEGTYLCVSFTADNVEDRQTLLNNYMEDHKLVPVEVLQLELLTDLFHSEQPLWELQVRVDS